MSNSTRICAIQATKGPEVPAVVPDDAMFTSQERVADHDSGRWWSAPAKGS